uniref:Ubiquinone biosynthesis O-methyltransferase, mitochondrial n=1 Tax=Plectus sambesii TaxID=2011161 RepID=A0A914X5K3_9BILA
MRTTARCRRLLPLRADLGRCLRTSLAAALQRPVPLHTNAAVFAASFSSSSSSLAADNSDVVAPSVDDYGSAGLAPIPTKRLLHSNLTTPSLSSAGGNDVFGFPLISNKWFKQQHNANQLRKLHTTAVDAPATKLSSIDNDDVTRFARLSGEWWDERGALKPLHSLNQARVPWIRDTLGSRTSKSSTTDDGRSSLAGLRLMDVGCGAGVLSEPLARLGAHVIGLDAADDAIDVARARTRLDPDLKRANIEYRCGSVESFVADNPKMVGSFDAIVASEVIEHVLSLESFLDACVQLVKPGGQLFFTTLNRTLLSRVMAIWVAEDVLGIVPQGVHDWNKFVPPNDLAALLEARGCNVRLLNGLCYNPLMNKWSWVADTSINYALMARKEA